MCSFFHLPVHGIYTREMKQKEALKTWEAMDQNYSTGESQNLKWTQTTNSWCAQVTNNRVQWVTRHEKQNSRSRCEGEGEVLQAMNELQGPVTGRCSGAIEG